MQEGSDGWPQVIDIYFEHNQTVARPQDRSVKIRDTGMYYLWFVNCDEDLSASTVAGLTTWKNPGGYLPGMMFPHIAFFAVMTLLYLVIMICWGLLYARHWTEVFFLQHFLTAVIVLGALEMSAWYFDYVNFNVTGHRPVVPTIWAVFVGDVRKTTSRVLIVMVSMGYGVVIPFLADLQKKVKHDGPTSAWLHATGCALHCLCPTANHVTVVQMSTHSALHCLCPTVDHVTVGRMSTLKT